MWMMGAFPNLSSSSTLFTLEPLGAELRLEQPARFPEFQPSNSGRAAVLAIGHIALRIMANASGCSCEEICLGPETSHPGLLLIFLSGLVFFNLGSPYFSWL
mmetsp:Transcript_73736/g.153681  ORF Transcript_73736/g.153681 Transcript_73736/m.153681 type:complete len:102 (+) Transcript_73736:214-519(+)